MTIKKLLLSGALSAISVFTAYNTAHAEEFTPSIHGLVLFEAQNDWTIDSDDTTTEVNTLTGTIEPYFILSLTENLTLETVITMEQVQSPDPNDDTFFDNEGAYISEIFLTYSGDNFSIFGGKIHPGFGTAWDLAPGIYGADFAEDYELAEKIGAGGSISFGEEPSGEYTLGATTFFADTTFM